MDHVGQPVVIKQAYVGDYGGKNVSVGREGEILFSFRDDDRAKEVKNQPNIKFGILSEWGLNFDFFQLEQWWGAAQDKNFTTLSQGSQGPTRNENFQNLDAMLKGENMDGDKPFYFSFKGTGAR